jgi:non-ribosomal peptide synthase protein (TIGR01720 family)
MVPSTFVTLEALPLTPVGKVDRRALPAPDQTRPELESAYVAPRTREEESLADIWAQVLGVEQVGVHDNFFELGGDSILSIQVTARANQAGLQLSARQLFQHPTVARLAAVAGRGAVVQAEQGVVEGPVPLTPIQRWFFEQDLPEPHHWNQAVLLEVRQPLDAALLEEAVEHLVGHHDALRLRFEQGESGWEQVNAGVNERVPFSWVDLSRLPETEQASAIEAHAAALQASLNLEAGPLVRVAYFDLGEGQPDRALMVVHHLAVDGVSWRILLEDLQVAYGQLKEGANVVLPAKTTSFQHWARRLTEYAQSEVVRQELDHWVSLTEEHIVRLPIDFPDGTNTEATVQSVTVSLSVEETQVLLQEVPAAYGTEINDALLTALAQAFAQWTGSATLLVDLEGHGRETLFEGVDLSRTVGWFTALFPAVLKLGGPGWPGETLMEVKEHLRRVPNRGIGYGLLRHLSKDEQVVKRLRALPRAEVSFNYLGQFDQVLTETSAFELARESRGPERSLRGRRTHLLSINGGILGGQLRMEWIYSEAMHRRETVEWVAEVFIEALREIIIHCRSSDAVRYTPSDFPDAELSQEDIEGLLVEIGEAI